MKRNLLLVLAMVLAGWVQAQPPLVDLTPGGFESGHFPPVFNKLFNPEMHFYDEAAQGVFGGTYYNGWVSLYGDLDGGTYFFTNLFVLNRPATATIWWNFIGAPAGFRLALIHTFGQNAHGIGWEHLYQVRLPLTGEARVTVDGSTPIMSIAFYGYER